MTRLAIFDLDGTLLNTIGDLAVSCNAVLALRGLPQHSYEDYCRFVGNGIMRLVERALPEALRTPYTVDAVRAISWRIISRISTNIRSLTREFPNCWPSCSGGACGWPSRRTSSRPAPRSSSAAISPTSASTWFWGSVPTCRSNPIRRSSARSLTATGVAAGEVLYVGDSGVDMQTAAAAGVRSAGVTWGFRTRAELEQSGARHIVDRPAELLGLL